MRKIFPIFAIALGLFWVAMSFRYGLWIRRGPGGGFFPLVGGLLCAGFGLIYLIGELRAPTPALIDGKFLHPILAVLAALAASYALGLLPALLLFIFLWLWLYEKRGAASSFLISACTTAGIWAVFVYWLVVPLPKGAVHAMIFG